MVIADAADKDGVCWPSLDYLVESTRLSKATVSRALADLQDGGYLSRRRRRAKSSVLTLCRERLAVALTPHPEDSHHEHPQGENPHGDGLNPHHEEVLKRTPKNPQSPSKRSKAAKPKIEEHPEGRKLAERLSELLVARKCKRPNIGKEWLDAGRLLLTADGRTFDEALAVLEWSQADRFWHKVVLSMPKFREKYDQLRLAALDRGELAKPAPRLDTADAVREWAKGEWRAGRTGEVERRAGLRYDLPDLPLDCRGERAAAEFYAQHARDWISTNIDEIVTRLTREVTAA